MHLKIPIPALRSAGSVSAPRLLLQALTLKRLPTNMLFTFSPKPLIPQCRIALLPRLAAITAVRRPAAAPLSPPAAPLFLSYHGLVLIAAAFSVDKSQKVQQV